MPRPGISHVALVKNVDLSDEPDLGSAVCAPVEADGIYLYTTRTLAKAFASFEPNLNAGFLTPPYPAPVTRF